MRERGWKTRAVKRTEAVRWTVSSCHSLCSSPSHTVRSRSLRAVWKGKRWTEWITLVSVARFLSLTSSLCPAVPYSHNRSIVSLSTWQDRDLNIPIREPVTYIPIIIPLLNIYYSFTSLSYGAGTAGERMVSGGEGVGMGRVGMRMRGEQTQGYEAKRVRGMKGVSHSRYVHSTCLSSL